MVAGASRAPERPIRSPDGRTAMLLVSGAENDQTDPAVVCNEIVPADESEIATVPDGCFAVTIVEIKLPVKPAAVEPDVSYTQTWHEGWPVPRTQDIHAPGGTCPAAVAATRKTAATTGITVRIEHSLAEATLE